jgi:hypothetical protein
MNWPGVADFGHQAAKIRGLFGFMYSSHEFTD